MYAGDHEVRVPHGVHLAADDGFSRQVLRHRQANDLLDRVHRPSA